MIRKSGSDFPKRSCSNKKIERDDDSKKSHHALGIDRSVGIGLPQPVARGLVGDLTWIASPDRAHQQKCAALLLSLVTPLFPARGRFSKTRRGKVDVTT